MIKQLTVFLENKAGSLVDLTQTLLDQNINIISFTIAETESYGLLRMVVTEPEKGEKILKEKSYSLSLTDVIGVEIPDRPGSLNKLLRDLKDFQIDYFYMFSNRKDISGVILRIEEEEKAEDYIRSLGYKLIETYKI